MNGRTNDTDMGNVKDNANLIQMVNCVQKYSNTTTVIVNIPHRNDLMKLDKTNLRIQAYNYKLKDVVKPFKHVSMVEMTTNWRHFTKHGLHLNSQEKEWLEKQIAIQIALLVVPSIF